MKSMESLSVVELRAMFNHAIEVINVYQKEKNSFDVTTPQGLTSYQDSSNLVDEFAGCAELLDSEIKRRIRLACKE